MKIDGLCKRNIQAIFLGSGNNYAGLNEAGQLFTWRLLVGLSKNNRKLTYNKNPKIELVAGEMANKKIVQVACGNRHMLALTDQGQVFWLESNTSGMGLKGKVTKGIGDGNAVAVACAALSSFVLLKDGRLVVWGQDWGSGESQNYPVRVLGLDGLIIRQVVCGCSHALALTDCGQIFAWGESQRQPVLVASEFGRAVQIAANRYRSAAMFEDKKVRVVGRFRYPKYNEYILGKWVECANIDEAFAPFAMWRSISNRNPTISTGTIAQSLQLTLNDKDTSDVCFQVGTKEILAHKKVLIKSCLYFDVMFQSRWIKSQKHKFKVDKHFSYTTFSTFLNYIYTHRLKKNCRLRKLAELADFYGHANLQLHCQYVAERKTKRIGN